MTCSQIGLKNIPEPPSEPRLAIPVARSAEATASRNYGAKSRPFNLKAKPFLHRVMLHNMDLEWNLHLHERLSQIVGMFVFVSFFG